MMSDYLAIVGFNEHGYKSIPRVEEVSIPHIGSREAWQGFVRKEFVYYFPVLAGQKMVHRLSVSPGRLSSGDSDQEGPSAPGSEDSLSPPARDLETVGLAPEGLHPLGNCMFPSRFFPAILATQR